MVGYVRRLLFILAPVALGPAAVFAGQPSGAGSIAAPVLVNDITAMDSAMAEVKRSKPEAKSGSNDVTAAGGPLPLPSQLEIVAGADHLIGLFDVLRQASLFAEARYRLSEIFQFGLSTGLRYQGDDVSKDIAAQILFGPVINFGDTGSGGGLKNAFFLSPKGGVTIEHKSENGRTTAVGGKATFSLSLGKRFALNDHFAFMPSLGVVKQANYSPCFVAMPIAISLFF